MDGIEHSSIMQGATADYVRDACYVGSKSQRDFLVNGTATGSWAQGRSARGAATVHGLHLTISHKLSRTHAAQVLCIDGGH